MTLGAATLLAAARMGPLALVAAPFGRAVGARAIVGALLVRGGGAVRGCAAGGDADSVAVGDSGRPRCSA